MPKPGEVDDRGASAKAGPADGVSEDSQDIFDEAFSKAETEDKQDLSNADDPSKVTNEEKAIPPQVTKEPDPEPAVQPNKAQDDPEQRYRTLQGILDHEKSEWAKEKASMVAAIEAANQAANSPKTPAKTPQEKKEADTKAQEFLDSLTDEQKSELDIYERDFDTISNMEGLKRARELAKLEKKLNDRLEAMNLEIAEKLSVTQSKIEPVERLLVEADREDHFSTVRNGYTMTDGTFVPGHGDFETYVKDGSVLNWIRSKPTYVRPLLENVYKEGQAQDVIELLADFKRENNIGASDDVPAGNVVDLNSRKAEKKAALAAVGNRRTAVNTGSHPSADYEGAFDEAIHKQGG